MKGTSSNPKNKTFRLRDAIYEYGLFGCIAFFFLAAPILITWGTSGWGPAMRYAKEYVILLGWGMGGVLIVFFVAKLVVKRDLTWLVGLASIVALVAMIGGGIRSCYVSEGHRIRAAKDRLAAFYDENLRATVTALTSACTSDPVETAQGFKPEGGTIIVNPDGTIAKESYVLTGSHAASRREDVRYIVVVAFKGNVSTGYWKRKGSVGGAFEGFASEYEFTIYQLQDQRVVVSETFRSGNYNATEKQDALRASVIEKLAESGFNVWMPYSVSWW